MKVTEQEMQDAVYVWARQKSHEVIVPNVFIYRWESDLLSVTRSGYVHEYEMKRSRSDFKAEKNKTWRLYDMSGEANKELVRIKARYPDWAASFTRHATPTYFWYVCPPDLIQISDLRDHEGLIYVHDMERIYGAVTVVREARRRHKNKLTDTDRSRLTRALFNRYWRLRTGLF